MERCYFIDTEIYFKNKKQPPRAVEVFNITKYSDTEVSCYDADGNEYILPVSSLIFCSEELTI